MEVRAHQRVRVQAVEECSLVEVLTEPRRRTNRRARVRKAISLHGVDAVHALWDADLLTTWQYEEALRCARLG